MCLRGFWSDVGGSKKPISQSFEITFITEAARAESEIIVFVHRFGNWRRVAEFTRCGEDIDWRQSRRH